MVLNAQSHQGVITGKLLDEKATPVSFANVTLLKASDSTFVAGALTDSVGRFSIPSPVAGSYVLRVGFLGYKDLTTPAFTVTDESFSKDFGTLTLNERATSLKEVTVTALRPTITQEADRLVMSVEGTAIAAGNTAFEVLSKAPGVFVDPEGNIQLNGKTGVTVMIDDKLTYLSARDLKTLLESMPAENIKNLETITNPSAKYDAQGSSGILNINLKKNTLFGVNGSVYGTWRFNGLQHGYSTGGNVNYKVGKWNMFLTLDKSRRASGREATFTRVFNNPEDTTYFDQNAGSDWYNHGPPNPRFGVDYSISDRHTVGFVGSYFTNTLHETFFTDTYIGNQPQQPVRYIDADNSSHNRFDVGSANVHYVGTFDTLGTRLSTDFDYARIRNRGRSDFNNYFTDLESGAKTSDILYNDITGGFDIYSGKVDLALPLAHKKVKLETGVKASRVLSSNAGRFYDNNGPEPVLDSTRTNLFDYAENIYAAYANANWKASDNWTLQGGLRAERTASVGTSITEHDVTKRDFTDLFPSVFVQQRVSDNYQINYGYSRRINRPDYGNLNPARIYRDPYTWYRGNPFLRPDYTHDFTLAQTVKKIYHVTLEYQAIRDMIAEVPVRDVANATTFTPPATWTEPGARASWRWCPSKS